MQEENQSANSETQNTDINETATPINDSNMTTYPELQNKDDVLAVIDTAKKQRIKRNIRRILVSFILIFVVITFIIGSVANATNNFGLAIVAIIPEAIVAILIVILIAMIANEKIHNHYEKKMAPSNKTKRLSVIVNTVAVSIVTLPFFAIFMPPYRIGLMAVLIFVGVFRYLITKDKEASFKYLIPAALMLIMFLLINQNY